MSYIPTVWVDLETPVNAENLNKMERGIAAAISQDDLQEATNEALAQAKESGEFNGPQGLKGDTGEQGPRGEKGDKGEDGYTPVKGTDYWTEADKSEIKAYVDEAILGGAW